MTLLGFNLKGLISMWSGVLASIPFGWVLCDGSNGTPNLLDLFVKGVPDALTDPGTTGGSPTHLHTSPNHLHSVPAHSHNSGANVGSSGGNRNPPLTTSFAYDEHIHGLGTSSAYDTGNKAVTINPASNDPAYFEVAFIMRLW